MTSKYNPNDARDSEVKQGNWEGMFTGIDTKLLEKLGIGWKRRAYGNTSALLVVTRKRAV